MQTLIENWTSESSEVRYVTTYNRDKIGRGM